MESQTKLLEIFASLTDGNRLCHGDFPFDNLLIGEQDVYIIDFMNVKGTRTTILQGLYT